jgi:predicted phosphodiesterase
MTSKRGETSGGITLTSSAYQVYQAIRRMSSDPLKSPTIRELAKQTKLSPGQIPHLISEIKNKGITVQNIKTEHDSKGRYFIGTDSLEKPVSRNALSAKGNAIYSALYLGDPAFGTRAANPEAMKGLITYLEKSGKNEEVQFVLMSGGVVPHVPPYATESYKQSAHFLGKTKRSPGEKPAKAERELEQRIDSIWPSDFFVKQLYDAEARKIVSLSDAFKESGERVRELMACFPEDTQLSIQWGEEDHLNKKHIEDALIAAWSKENEGRAKEEREGILGDYMKTYNSLATAYVKRNLLEKRKKPNESQRDFKRRIREETIGDIDDFAEDVERDLDGRGSILESQEKLVRARFKKEFKKKCYDPAAEYTDKVRENPKTTNRALEAVNGQIERIKQEAPAKTKELEQRLEDADRDLSWVDTLLGDSRSQITMFTKQYPIKSDAVGAAHRVAKDMYAARFHQWDIPQVPNVHDSHRKTITIPTLPIIGKDGKVSHIEAELDYSIEQKGDKSVLLVHNIRSNFSNSTTADALKKAKDIINFDNMVLNKLYAEKLEREILPDLVIVGSHGSGAFRAQPWFHSSDEIVRGNLSGKEYTPEERKMCWLLQLPKFQNLQQLMWLRDKGFKNAHVKAMESGPFATAAILHSEDSEGVSEYTVLDTAYLEQLSEIDAQIQIYQKETKTLEGQAKETVKQEIGKLRSKLERMVNGKRTSIEAMGDAHIGTINVTDAPSNYQMVKALNSYFSRHGLPDIVSLDEILHGCEDGMFKGAARYEGMNPEEFRQRVVEKVLANVKNGTLTETEAIQTLASESVRNLQMIPVHNEAVQLSLYNRLLKEPFLDKVIANGGKLIFTSGNHYGHANRNDDEALKLAGQYPEAYRESGKVIANSGLGNPVGVGTIILPGEQKLFVMHKFKEQNDEVYGMMAQLRRSNNNCDIVIGGDRHHPGIGYADGHLVVLHPGLEPINGYVPTIGKPSGVRGANVIEYIPGVKGIASVKSIFDPTLERIIEKENII